MVNYFSFFFPVALYTIQLQKECEKECYSCEPQMKFFAKRIGPHKINIMTLLKPYGKVAHRR